jgi:minimal PKS chain-length factor (CLF/KS beta)
MMSSHTLRDVVVTGLGLIAPCGIGQQAFWAGLQSPEIYLTPYTQLSIPDTPTVYAAEVSQWQAEHYLPRKLIRQTDRHTHFALAATDLALHDAQIQLENEDPERIGVVISATLGGMEFAERELYTLWAKSPRAVSAYQSIAWFYAASQGQITIAHGLRGYSKSIVSDRSGAIQALGHAYHAIKEGRADVLLAGGAEAPLTPFSLLCYIGAGIVNTQAHTAEQAYLPFDQEAAGIALGEGAALFVLEEYEHARRRNAPILARVSGYATNCNAHMPMASYQDHAQKLAHAMTSCIKSQEVKEPPIDYIHPDGAAQHEADMAEVEAIKMSLKKAAYRVPISVPKALIGDAIGAGGAFAAAITVLSLQQQCVLPTPYIAANRLISDMDFVLGEPRHTMLRRALVIARSTTNINAVIAFTHPDA